VTRGGGGRVKREGRNSDEGWRTERRVKRERRKSDEGWRREKGSEEGEEEE